MDKKCVNNFSNKKFLIIEAQKSKEKILKDLFLDRPNVAVEICLLGDESNKVVEFYEMETGSSIYSENTNHPRKSAQIEMKTLDSLHNYFQSEDSIFLKIDVQGAEIDVLKGAKNTLIITEFILLEISVLNFNENAPMFYDVVFYMESIGFKLFDICEENRNENGILFQLDAIFINKTSEINKKVDFKSKLN
jgi:FkbM family methyltransferase